MELKKGTILKQVFPAICMMIFLSLYTIIDGAFISQLVGLDALAATNIAFPYVNFLLGISIMLGAGGCALIMIKVGEGDLETATKEFSLLILTAIVIGGLIMIISVIFLDEIIAFLGTPEHLYHLVKSYIIPFIIFAIPTILKFIMEQFLIATNHANLALLCTILGGICNIILDYIFLKWFEMGLKGAAFATGLGYFIPTLIGLIFFINPKRMLHFTKPSKDIKMILKACGNGSSEMITQCSNGMVTFLFNLTTLKYFGEEGVSTITIFLYIQFLVSAVFMGYSIGIAPKMSYFYGNKNKEALKNMFRFSLQFICIASVLAYLLVNWNKERLVSLFATAETTTFTLAIEGLQLYSIAFLLLGFPVFISSMFTAFSNGKISAFISIFRALICESIAIIVFPFLFPIKFLWLSVPFAQICSCILCYFLYIRYGKKYFVLKFCVF